MFDRLDKHISRRGFLKLSGAALGALTLAHVPSTGDWPGLLDDYEAAARGNIVEVEGRRALLSSPLYPGIYVRDSLFGAWGLGDAALGFDCYQWFAETQLESGQVRTAAPLHPHEHFEPQDDESSLLFVIASDWLRRRGYRLDEERIARAYAWVQTHVRDHTYISPPGPFRYWADTVSPNFSEAIAYNQGLLCLARRAMTSMGLGGVTAGDVAAARECYRSFYDATWGYLTLGKHSRFARTQDVSAIFPEFLSRYLYDEPILADEMVVSHAARIRRNASVYYADGRLAGLKVISAASGDFLPQTWFHAPTLNSPGEYHNGGYWPLYTLVALALAYAITGYNLYTQIIAQLVVNELAADHQPKEIIKLAPGQVGTFDPARANHTWNALIRAACVWCGLTG
jgi:hypothetical protein